MPIPEKIKNILSNKIIKTLNEKGLIPSQFQDKELKSVIGADERMWINDHWEVPGPDGRKGWGGKCFPKNLELIKEMGFNNEFCKLMKSFNEDQRGFTENERLEKLEKATTRAEQMKYLSDDAIAPE